MLSAKQLTAAVATDLPYFVAIGASGQQGLTEIKALLTLLPRDIQAMFLVTLHRPTDRISHLRQVLSRVSSIP
jgi:two-component system chemotaxis response regulator CheB